MFDNIRNGWNTLYPPERRAVAWARAFATWNQAAWGGIGGAVVAFATVGGPVELEWAYLAKVALAAVVGATIAGAKAWDKWAKSADIQPETRITP